MIELVGVAEIAKKAGVKPNTVHKWRQRHPDFPKPLVELEAGPVWDYADIEAWLKRPRPPGRPTTTL